jgi:hypothetical protein
MAARVKVYGIVRMTRRAYLTTQVVGLLMAVALMVFALCAPHPESVDPRGKRAAFAKVFGTFLDWLPWICLLVIVLGAVETYVVLGRFKKAELAHTDPPAGG